MPAGRTDEQADTRVSGGLGRLLLGAGGAVRLSYGLGALLMPDAMCSHSLAPDVLGHADGRMNLRGFGGLHVAIAVLTLRAAALNRNTRLLLGLGLGCELSDMTATLLEWRQRGAADRTVIGSLALATVGLATWTTALRAQRAGQDGGRQPLGKVVCPTSIR